MKRFRVTLWIKGIDGESVPFIYYTDAADSEGAEVKARNEYEEMYPTNEIVRGQVQEAEE